MDFKQEHRHYSDILRESYSRNKSCSNRTKENEMGIQQPKNQQEEVCCL